MSRSGAVLPHASGGAYDIVELLSSILKEAFALVMFRHNVQKSVRARLHVVVLTRLKLEIIEI